MSTLAIETSSPCGSIAWKSETGEVIRYAMEATERPSEGIFKLLQKLDLPKRPVRRLLVGIGPGSFSGIRAGIAAAQAIALVKNSELLGICSAWSIALQRPTVTRLGVFADARRGERYLTIFSRGTLERASFLLKNEAVEEYLSKLTEAVSAEELPFIPERAAPRAEDFLQLPDSFDDWVKTEPLEPIYLRTPVAA